MQQGKPGRATSTSRSTCSRSTASRSSTWPLTRAARAARASCSTSATGRAGVGAVRRRRGALPGRQGAALRGHRRQARRLAVPARPPLARLAEDQDARQQEFVVGGLHEGRGPTRASFGSLLLGDYDGGEAAVRRQRRHRVQREGDRAAPRPAAAARAATPPFDPVPKLPRVRKGDIRWVEPKLVAEVEFVEWTHDGRLRAPSYKGLREDKPPEEVHEEEPLADGAPQGQPRAQALEPRQALLPGRADHEGRPARVLPRGRAGARAAPEGPAVHDGPLPDGIEGKRFFQKDAPSHMPEWIPRYRALVSTRESPRRKKWVEFPLVNDELALLWMVNMGCIDMNAWYSRVDKPERPDFVLFDLDPSPDVGFTETVQVALLVKAGARRARARRLPEDVERGRHARARPDRAALHVRRTRGASRRSSPARSRARTAGSRRPSGRSRSRGVLIDANQNGEGKTIASVYSVRPRRGAPVSTPLRWEEVNEDLDPRASRWDSCGAGSRSTATSSRAC